MDDERLLVEEMIIQIDDDIELIDNEILDDEHIYGVLVAQIEEDDDDLEGLESFLELKVLEGDDELDL